MLAHFIRPSRKEGPPYDQSFVREVTVRVRTPRNRRVERMIALCWGVIVAKCAAVFWLFGHYAVPMNPLWVVGPTVFLAALGTALYLLRD
jgi:hypothetical protein